MTEYEIHIPNPEDPFDVAIEEASDKYNDIFEDAAQAALRKLENWGKD